MSETLNKDVAVIATVTFTLDGREVSVPKGTSILEAAQQFGIDIPTFCWHPKLTAAGSCRMCYVEIEKWPKLAISCATEAMDGMVVYTDTEKVRQGRQAIIEFTLINHPLDCPTCDKGGECTLQDLTYSHGIGESRFDFQKTRFVEKDVDSTFDDLKIGPEIMLNRNRCILCYRCVRANKEAFGEYDLGAFERGNHTEIGAAPGREVGNPFSGNLVEICPVGALTNDDWRYQIRVWNAQTASSVCPFYSSGSNTLIYKNEHQGRIFRVTSRTNDAIDDGWLSDVTRYGYQIATQPDRLKRPLIKKDGQQVEATWTEALSVIQKRLVEIRDKKGRVCIGALVSPTLDNASLFSFSKLMRKVLGSNNIDYRTDYRMLPKTSGGAYDILCDQPFTIADIDSSDLIISIGSDLLKEHPNEYLRIRKAVNFGGAKVYACNPYGTKTSDVTSRELIYEPGTEEMLINGICLVAIEDSLIAAADAGDLLGKISPATAVEAASLCGLELTSLREIAAALAKGQKITVIAGEIVSRSRNRETIAAALCNLQRLFGLNDKGQMAILPRYANSRGAAKLGLLSDPDPALKQELTALWGEWPEADPTTTDRMFVDMKKEEINGCLVIGANPVMLYPDREFANDALEGLDFLVVADLYETETTALADVVLPLAAWTDYDGEYVNLEGTVQTAKRALKKQSDMKPGFEIADLIATQLGQPLFESDAERSSNMKRTLAVDSSLTWPDTYLEVKHGAEELEAEYPLAMYVGDDPHHSGHLTEKSPSLARFQSEAYVEMSKGLAARLELGAGDSARVESVVGKIIVPVKISAHIANDVVFVPRNFSATIVNALLMRKRRVDRVKISKVVD